MATPSFSYQWTTSFATPAALTGLAVVADVDSIALVATCNASGDTFHYEYLWEAQVNDGPWLEVGRTATPTFTYYFANLNTNVRIRVSDSNGALYSTTVETVGLLPFTRWAMSHRTGNANFIQELRYVLAPLSTDLPLDQVAIQPLSDLSGGSNQLPIVFTGQWQGERLGFTMHLKPEDSFLRQVFEDAVFEDQGNIALKDPKGNVYIVQLGSLHFSDIGAGQQRVDLAALRIA
jgi:hypothetical protein